ncbi:MAG: hypothetical protein CUN55_15955 [Phototrophicales bacterium]|nr:MAG: hypothetical protein CUN55_15955 [Phototrophicales bacterium]RMG89223.1 MAG: hypothetical protein D6712_02110 [Chloroflexota bacterium]
MMSDDFTLTKRQLGILLFAIGTIGFLAIISIDLLDVGREGGIGPAQRIALILMASLAVLGLTLIPLKDDPA